MSPAAPLILILDCERTCLNDPGPSLTPAGGAAFHKQPESVAVAWFAIPAPHGAGVIARAHTEAQTVDGGCGGT